MKIIALLIFVVSSCTSVNASPLPDKPHIYVEGSAEIEVEPDTLKFSVNITDTNMDVSVA